MTVIFWNRDLWHSESRNQHSRSLPPRFYSFSKTIQKREKKRKKKEKNINKNEKRELKTNEKNTWSYLKRIRSTFRSHVGATTNAVWRHQHGAGSGRGAGTACVAAPAHQQDYKVGGQVFSLILRTLGIYTYLHTI